MRRSAKRGTTGTLSVRTVLQGVLGCCGWSGPLHGAAASGTCYTRSPLPGCHGPLVRYILSSVAGTVFSLVLLHLVNIFVGLLCANHVTHHFGKGITPARYCLSAHDIIIYGIGRGNGITRSTTSCAERSICFSRRQTMRDDIQARAG